LQQQIDQQAINLYGRPLEEQEQYLQLVDQQRKVIEEQRKVKQKEIEHQQQVYSSPGQPMRQALIEHYLEHAPDKEPRFTTTLQERGMLDEWRRLRGSVGERLLDEARRKAGWEKDTFGHWHQQAPPAGYQ
jgi:hypothetical protein